MWDYRQVRLTVEGLIMDCPFLTQLRIARERLQFIVHNENSQAAACLEIQPGGLEGRAEA